MKGPLAEENLISLAEAAALSGLSASHLKHLAEGGKLKARKIGRNWVTSEAAVSEYLANEGMRKRDPYKNRRLT